MSGANQLDERRLAAEAGGAKCQRADADLVRAATGYPDRRGPAVRPRARSSRSTSTVTCWATARSGPPPERGTTCSRSTRKCSCAATGATVADLRRTREEAADRSEHSVAYPPPGDEHHRLDDDPPGHLRCAPDAIAERDRHLDDLPARRRHDVGHLDLEAVPVGAHRVEVDRVQQRRRGRPGSPPCESCTPRFSTAAAYRLPHRERSRRCRRQFGMEPPGTYRLTR